MVSQYSWEAARSFILSHARPLEQSLFSYYFDGGAKADAVNELSFFQNEDGGFGNSLEPDFRLAASSPMATTVGLQIAKELDLQADHPIVDKAMSYLESSYDSHTETWHAVPAEVNDVPHAPWWHFDSVKGVCGVESTWANPNAEIVGYFHLYRPTNHNVGRWTRKAVKELASLPDPIEMHDFLCYSRLLQCLPQSEMKREIHDKLIKSVHGLVCKDPEKWDEYVTKPLMVAPSPSSPFYTELKDEVTLQLDVEMKKQHDDGYWQPNWTWFGHYEDSWPKAEQEWRGILTLSMLRSIDAFEKIKKQQTN
ncbi:hypothetical protein LCM10_01655 [Rossellomorea aquimaris]|uniref:hypothetical protein n=1 Tax=Rossellomorea aquimaris TaxID=189382 RepID=UPI001CD1D1EC|nr:hypothetical protein [Rossellomorea aquimaris]MCA1053675.1 hypothetical protein [Rossellomorea aquimaris]